MKYFSIILITFLFGQEHTYAKSNSSSGNQPTYSYSRYCNASFSQGGAMGCGTGTQTCVPPACRAGEQALSVDCVTKTVHHNSAFSCFFFNVSCKQVCIGR